MADDDEVHFEKEMQELNAGFADIILKIDALKGVLPDFMAKYLDHTKAITAYAALSAVCPFAMAESYANDRPERIERLSITFKDRTKDTIKLLEKAL